MSLEFKLLALIIAANGAPILVTRLFGSCCDYPLDGNRRFIDSNPLLGQSKTVRGLAAAVITVIIFALLLGFGWKTGLVIGAFAMLGDLFSSFIKRRLGMPPSSMAFGLDQIPESLFPLIAVSAQFQLGWRRIAILVLFFIIIELVLSRILYWLKIRKRPY